MPVEPGYFRMVKQERPAQKKKDGHNRKLDDHDSGVQIGGFLDADDQDRGNDQDGKESDKVEQAGNVGQSRALRIAAKLSWS